MKDKNKGIIFIIISAFFFALMNMFVKLSGDLPTLQKVFFRNAVAAIFAFIVLVKNKAPLKPAKKGNLKFLILRTVCGLLGVICNFYAIDRLVLSDASILNKMSPFFVILFSFLLIKEKPNLTQWLTVIGAFFGAVFVIKPSFSNAAFIPSLIGFMSGAFAGAAYTFVRKLGTLSESGPYIVFFFSFVSTVVMAPFFIIEFTPMSALQWLYLGLAGVCACLAQFAVTAAYRSSPPKEISVYDFSQIIFAGLLSLIVFAEIPDFYSLIGYFIIILMAVINYIFQNRKKHREDYN